MRIDRVGLPILSHPRCNLARMILVDVRRKREPEPLSYRDNPAYHGLKTINTRITSTTSSEA
jgi:hypothetical protein